MRSKSKDNLAGYVFTAPYIIGALVFFVLPAAASLYFAMCKYPMIASPVFTGLENVKKLMEDDNFKKAFVNTVYFALLYAPAQTLLALLFAVFLNKSVRFFKGKSLVVFRAIYYFPSVAPWFVIGTIWVWLLNRDIGLVNLFLNFFGIDSIVFLHRDSPLLIPSLVFVSVWKGLGYMMFIFLIGLQNISAEFYEAAQIDGVSWWQRLRYITFPLLSPTTFFILILSTLWGFQSFEQGFMMVYDRIELASINLLVYLYNEGFKYFKMGYASLIAWVLFIVIGIFTFIQTKLQNWWVHYE